MAADDKGVGSGPNQAAVTRLVGALLLEQHDEGDIQRRYMSLETLAPLSDTAPRQPAARGTLTRGPAPPRAAAVAILHHVMGQAPETAEPRHF